MREEGEEEALERLRGQVGSKEEPGEAEGDRGLKEGKEAFRGSSWE